MGPMLPGRSTLSVFFHQDSGIFVLEFLCGKHSPGLDPFILASNEDLEILGMIQPQQARKVPFSIDQDS